MNHEHANLNHFLLKVLVVAAATAVYGAVLAAWRSPRMAAYVAVKLPCVFLGTTLVVSVFCWMAALATGAALRYREVLGAVFTAMAVAGTILLGLAPVVLFFILSGAPDEGTRQAMRFAHAAMMSALFFLVALQTVTLIRPMLSPVGTERNPDGKCFFIRHFKETVLDGE